MPHELQQYKGHTGKQTENRFSHWIWRQYASSFWDDIRIDRVIPYKESRDADDERHCHPLQLDVIERACVLWSNPGDLVYSPFAGIGSEGYCSLKAKRRFVGVELKAEYFNQACRTLHDVEASAATLFDDVAA